MDTTRINDADEDEAPYLSFVRGAAPARPPRLHEPSLLAAGGRVPAQHVRHEAAARAARPGTYVPAGRRRHVARGGLAAQHDAKGLLHHGPRPGALPSGSRSGEAFTPGTPVPHPVRSCQVVLGGFTQDTKHITVKVYYVQTADPGCLAVATIPSYNHGEKTEGIRMRNARPGASEVPWPRRIILGPNFFNADPYPFPDNGGIGRVVDMKPSIKVKKGSQLWTPSWCSQEGSGQQRSTDFDVDLCETFTFF
ncbi:hypothetical protein PWT90_10253 [Aphanocladium album]|nr:hypothetical protein PWT90_10253 [Aphanocladium album]